MSTTMTHIKKPADQAAGFCFQRAAHGGRRAEGSVLDHFGRAGILRFGHGRLGVLGLHFLFGQRL